MVKVLNPDEFASLQDDPNLRTEAPCKLANRAYGYTSRGTRFLDPV